MRHLESLVFVVDNDESTRATIQASLTPERVAVIGFRCIAEYVAFRRPDLPSCVVMDVQLPDGDGLEFQRQVDDLHPPFVFTTDRFDIRLSVRAMKSGAVNFLTKPLNESELTDSIHAATEQDRQARAEKKELASLRQRLLSLTPREREVLPLIVGGLLNKQAAAVLAISEITLQIHRGRLMRKMKADSLPDLVRIAERLRVPIAHSRRENAFRADPRPVDQRSRFDNGLAMEAAHGKASAGSMVLSVSNGHI